MEDDEFLALARGIADTRVMSADAMQVICAMLMRHGAVHPITARRLVEGVADGLGVAGMKSRGRSLMFEPPRSPPRPIRSRRLRGGRKPKADW